MKSKWLVLIGLGSLSFALLPDNRPAQSEDAPRKSNNQAIAKAPAERRKSGEKKAAEPAAEGLGQPDSAAGGDDEEAGYLQFVRRKGPNSQNFGIAELGGDTSEFDTEPSTDPDSREESATFSSLVQGQTTDRAAAERSTQGEMMTAAKPDLAGSLSEEIDSLTSQVRQPISASPYIRGFRNGQIYGQLDGVYWTPARLDLDTILSKIDPGTVQSVNVIAGPYSSLYGPAFAYIDAYSIPTPRYRCPETHYQTNASYLNNGRQWYGRETVFGGGSNYGYRLSYGHRTGSDYRAGDDRFIPSSYNNRDIRGDFGYDINPDQRLEFSYRHIDLTNAEYPGQFFDTNYLGVDSYSLALFDQDPFAPWTVASFNAWYNRTQYNGDNSRSSKSQFDLAVVPRVADALQRSLRLNAPPAFIGLTYGDTVSTGARALFTFGDLDDANLTTGADVRYLNQGITERYDIQDFGTTINRINTNLPDSGLVNPGLFSELVLPTSSYVRTAIGSRIDLVHTDLSSGTVLPGGYLATTYPNQGFGRDDALYAFYMTNRVDLDANWSANLDFGHAQRPPSLIDRYSDGIFLGIIQNGFSRVIGNPNVKKERNWQLDLGLTGTYDNWRGSIRGFQSFIVDYITYTANEVQDPTSARLLNTINTPYATLSGFELSNDFDLNEYLTPFAQVAYVYGHDQIIGKPLPQIPPLQSRLGIRLHDRGPASRWGFEVFARVVAQQGREAILRGTGGGLVPVEQQTGGFTTAHLRGYWSVNRNLHLISGIDNVFDRGYFEHLSLRLPAQAPYPAGGVFSPGFSPYFSMQWTY